MDTSTWNNTGSYHPPGSPSPPSSFHAGPILTFALCLLLLVFRPTASNSYSKSRRRPPPYPKGNHLFPAPMVGTRIPVLSRLHFFFRGPSLIREGYAKYKDVPFKLSGHDYLILPAKYLAELSRMPPERLSLNLAIAEVFQRHPGVTGVMTDHSVQKKAVAARLTAGLPEYIPRMQLQIGRALEEAVGRFTNSVKKSGGDDAASEGWKPVRIHDLAQRMTQLTVSPGFVVELAEDENYMSATEQFVRSSFLHLVFLQAFPEWAKPFAALVFPPSWRVDWALDRARGLLIPIIEERRRRLRLEREGEQQYTKPDDLLQHLMDVGDEAGGEDAEATMQRLMAMNFGGCGAAVDATAKVLLDLCEHPECVEPIRREIVDVLARDGGVSFSKKGLAEMKRLDSFMRESHRWGPTTHLALDAIARQPLTLHDGTVIPQGAHVRMAAYNIGVDPEREANADIFDGFRYYHARQRPGEENGHQFTTRTENYLHFGYGTISCPGRFFVSAVIKLIVSNIILKYRFRFPGGSTRRPASRFSALDVEVPDFGALVEFQLREGGPDDA